MILSTSVGLGVNTNLVTFDQEGAVVRDVQVAASGDVFPAPGSAVHDATVTEAGDLVLAAAITGYPAGAGPPVENLESWNALIRLLSPAGLGDLAEVPIRQR